MYGDANRGALYISTETNWGETPATPAMTQLPFTGESLSLNKQVVKSNTIRSDRQRDAIPEIEVDVTGDIKVELAVSVYDTLITGLMNAAAVVCTTASTLSAVNPNQITRAAGSFITDGYVVNMWVRVKGFINAANNGFFQVSAVTATTLTLTGIPVPAFVAEANTSNVSISAKMWRNGTTKSSYLIEKQFLDINRYRYFSGLRVGQMTLDLNAGAIVTGAFQFMGKNSVGSGATVSGSLTPTPVQNILTASANVGSILLNGALMAQSMKSFHITANNNLRKQPKVGAITTGGLGLGFFEPSGKLDAYYEDDSLMTIHDNHTSLSLVVPLIDTPGNQFILTLPKVYLTKGQPTITGVNTDVTVPFDWEAVRDPNTNCMMQIDELLF